MEKRLLGLIGVVLVAGLVLAACALAPISTLPPAERGVPVITAEPWLKISDNESWNLEGPAFDRQGNLFIVEIGLGQVLKITPDKKVTTILVTNLQEPRKALYAGCAIHKDGRLFLADLKGKVVAINPDGTGLTTILDSYQGKPVPFIDDVAFDKQGNLYVTQLAGNAVDRIGRVFRISSDFQKVDVVLNGLAGANGIVFAPDYSCLYVSEFGGNTLLRVQLNPDGISPAGMWGGATMYRYTGKASADSLQVDAAGNIYQALFEQGRVLILSPDGIPVKQVLVPDRDKNMYMRTTHVMVKPGTDEAYLTASGKGGAWIFKFPALAKSPPNLFSHQ
jgi:lactonase